MDENEIPMWEQEPQFLRWQVRTWEHAALFPESSGLTARVQDSKRMLPEELTAPIYAASPQERGTFFDGPIHCPPLTQG
jgi:hypothetical protein